MQILEVPSPAVGKAQVLVRSYYSVISAGTEGKAHVFTFNNDWEGEYFKEKEVTVYYKKVQKKIILLTALVRYDEDFQ